MLEWQGIECRILKLKLHSCIAYRVVGAGVGGRHGYWLFVCFSRDWAQWKRHILSWSFIGIEASPLP
jgi:hypothetical protein